MRAELAAVGIVGLRAVAKQYLARKAEARAKKKSGSRAKASAEAKKPRKPSAAAMEKQMAKLRWSAGDAPYLDLGHERAQLE